MNQEKIIQMAKEADLWLTSDERIAAVERFAELVAQHQREKDREQAVALLRQLHDSFSLESSELRIGKWEAKYDEKYKYGTPLLDAFTKENK
jgi:outer membrane protein assembly factor BamD (BamD/ComL family)